jgi:hypothetical protein
VHHALTCVPLARLSEHMDMSRRTGRIAVRVRAWGVTGADVEHALHRAGQAPSRNAWEFEQIERATEVKCSLDLNDPGVLAADQGYHWAYVVKAMSQLASS